MTEPQSHIPTVGYHHGWVRFQHMGVPAWPLGPTSPGDWCRPLCSCLFQAAEEEEEMDLPDSASRVFCGRILSMVNTDDVNAIILAQKNMLDRFEKTNEMLLNFNNLSSARLQQMSERFLHHTRTLVEMKRDLDSIFRRIRTLKGKLARQHPEAFSHIPEASFLEEEDEDPIPPSTTTTIATSEQSTGSCDTSPDTVSPSLSPGFEDLSHVQPGSPAINGRSQTDEEETTGE
ncbi:kxDL motif-containing protein 1 isoform X1 [Macaca mulatta]